MKLLSRESVEVLRQPGFREQLLKQGMEVEGSSPRGLRDQLETEIVKWARVIRDAGIKPGSE